MKRIKIIFLASIFVSTISSVYAAYEVTNGAASSRLPATSVECSSNANSVISAAAERIYSHGEFYASPNGSSMDFSWTYPKNMDNDQVKVATYIYQKGTTDLKNYHDAFGFQTLSTGTSGSYVRTKTSSKTYDGEYFIMLGMQSVADTSQVCVIYGGKYINIQDTTANQAPEVSSVTATVQSNGDVQVRFYQHDPEGSTMGANIYLSYANNTGSFNFNSKKSLGSGSNNTYRTVTYTAAELSSLGIANGNTFKARVNVFDNQSAEGIGYSSTTTYVANEDLSALIDYLNANAIINKMQLSSNLDDQIARSDAIVLIDNMLLLNGSTIKDMTGYYNPFADVPDDVEYINSLMRLAYYKSTSFIGTPINKENLFFNPMRHMSREEFLAVALTAFNITYQNSDLSSFDDEEQMSDWAVKYFKTAVYYGIIVGNNNKLLAYDKISIREALYVLNRIWKIFGALQYNDNSYEEIDSFDSETSAHKTIGYEYEPRSYNSSATPIDVTSISKSFIDGKTRVILEVSSTSDIANGATPYYWWESNKGYFKKYPGSNNFSKVYFYPTRSQTTGDYVITVNGGDDLGYIDSLQTTIPSTNFVYEEDAKTIDTNEVQTSALNAVLSDVMRANKVFVIDLSATTVKKENIDLGIDHVQVGLETASGNIQLFKGTPTAKIVKFVAPYIPELYGETLNITVTTITQKIQQTATFTKKYVPVFAVSGKVYEVDGEPKTTSIKVGGQTIYLDENDEFHFEFSNTSPMFNLSVEVPSSIESNYFKSFTIDLDYVNPQQYIVLIGEDNVKDVDGDGISDSTDPNLNDGPYADPDQDGLRNEFDNDDDNDGMPDSYEQQYPNWLNQWINDANEDPDLDGYSNIQEYRSGTSPVDDKSVPDEKDAVMPSIIQYLLG